MKLVKLICGRIERYTFLEELKDMVFTLDYFEYDELWYDSPVWSKVYPISKEEYIANYATILDELEDTLVAFPNSFRDAIDWRNMSDEEFLNAEHQYILTHIYGD